MSFILRKNLYRLILWHSVKVVIPQDVRHWSSCHLVILSSVLGHLVILSSVLGHLVICSRHHRTKCNIQTLFWAMLISIYCLIF